jgi:hypothetical protein
MSRDVKLDKIARDANIPVKKFFSALIFAGFSLT